MHRVHRVQRVRVHRVEYLQGLSWKKEIAFPKFGCLRCMRWTLCAMRQRDCIYDDLVEPEHDFAERRTLVLVVCPAPLKQVHKRICEYESQGKVIRTIE